MIKNYKKLSIGIVLLLICLMLNMPFPHRYPFEEKILASLHIPTRISLEKGSSGGFHVLFIFSMIFLVAGLYFLEKSVHKHHGRLIVTVFIAISVIPNMLVNVYQTNFATGIYAVSYNSEASTCVFDMEHGKGGFVECELRFGNYSDKALDFEVVFVEESSIPFLMHEEAPYHITLGANEWKTVKIRTNIDVSDTEYSVTSGEARGVHTVIRLGDKEREL